ncbi:DUF6452 family protein [Aequorivita sp. Q41]|uniref:DUF6452 family protein n=1 Tax=Aequorivita sp. Q41 TaxID=3153300 RepID=UPI0032421D02
MLKKIIVLILLIFAFKSCTKDDICPDGTATTSNLVIQFNDIINPLNSKNVEVLTVLTDNIDSVEVVTRLSTNSITIPLNTNADTTKYMFIRSIISTTDTIVNIDKVSFIYQRSDGYVNRACGFKMEFDNLSSNLENEGTENWIQQVSVIRDTVNDENSPHITMLH